MTRKLRRRRDRSRPDEGQHASRSPQATALRVGRGRASSRLVVYPPVAERRERARRIVVKGDPELAVALAAALEDFRGPRPRSRGIIEVEVDPVEWPS